MCNTTFHVRVRMCRLTCRACHMLLVQVMCPLTHVHVHVHIVQSSECVICTQLCFFNLLSVSRHQPEVNLLSQQWAEFHTHYQSFHQWLRNMDTEMANLNPFISNMATVQMQLWKLKVQCIHNYMHETNRRTTTPLAATSCKHTQA